MRFQRRAALAASILTACCATAHAQQVTGNAFNPAISLILNGHYASYSRNPADWALSGFMLDRDAGLPSEHRTDKAHAGLPPLALAHPPYP